MTLDLIADFGQFIFLKLRKKVKTNRFPLRSYMKKTKVFLKILGDFTAWYVEQDPSKLLNIPWEELSKEILQNFYQFAGLETPQWIDYFVEQRDAVDESSEKTFFGLRAILANKINEACSKYLKVYGTCTEGSLK